MEFDIEIMIVTLSTFLNAVNERKKLYPKGKHYAFLAVFSGAFFAAATVSLFVDIYRKFFMQIPDVRSSTMAINILVLIAAIGFVILAVLETIKLWPKGKANILLALLSAALAVMKVIDITYSL